MTERPSFSPGRATFPIWAWLAAIALALLTGYLVRQMSVQTAQLDNLRRQIRRAEVQNQALQAQLEAGQQISAILLAPESKVVKLDSQDARLPPLLVYLHPHMGAAIVGDNFAAIPASRTYQLWITPKQGDMTSVAIFRPNADGLVSVLAPVSFPADFIAAITVTDEPSGGSPKPTSSPLWAAHLK